MASTSGEPRPPGLMDLPTELRQEILLYTFPKHVANLECAWEGPEGPFTLMKTYMSVSRKMRGEMDFILTRHVADIERVIKYFLDKIVSNKEELRKGEHQDPLLSAWIFAMMAVDDILAADNNDRARRLNQTKWLLAELQSSRERQSLRSNVMLEGAGRSDEADK